MMDRIRGTGAGVARAASAALLVALLVGALVAGAAGSSPAVTGPTASQSTTATEAATLAQEIDADRTRIRIALQPDGDARWTVELWTRLEDDADQAAFAGLQADVRNDSEAFTADFRGRMNGSVTAASDATGREMAIRNVTVATRTEGVPSSYGVLVYEFEWTNFAVVDGDRLRAGDAIDGFLLQQHTRLTISWPAGYRLADVDPAPDDRTDAAVVWQGGETDFLTGQPRVAATDAPAEGDSLLPLVAAVVGLLAVLFVLAWLVHSGRLGLPWRGDSTPSSPDESAAGGATGAAAGAAGTAAAEGGDDPIDDAEDTDDAPDEVPPELLSNEEQVLRLLEANGGRLKQQQVVAELEWTEAKTSQVVTSMREDDRIEVFRIGRENVLALPEEADL